MGIEKDDNGNVRIVIEQFQFHEQAIGKISDRYNHSVPIVSPIPPSLALLTPLFDACRTTNADEFAEQPLDFPRCESLIGWIGANAVGRLLVDPLDAVAQSACERLHNESMCQGIHDALRPILEESITRPLRIATGLP
jgi:hypothetical protein